MAVADEQGRDPMRGFIDGTDAHRSAWGLDTEHDVDAWKDDALCAQVDPEIFFPEKGSSTREAKRVCLACTVRDECLDYALEHDERFGIFGGLSERERRALKRGERSREVDIPRQPTPRNCEGCGGPIPPGGDHRARYCSGACRTANRRNCA